MPRKYPKRFLDRLRAVKGKRSRAVLDHIRKHGCVTTEELRDTYGYDHPPRAARDVREQGIQLETYKVAGSHGRKIAAYRLADPRNLRGNRLAGRRALSKKFKSSLVARDGARCAICSCTFEPRYLQVDHRVPYEVAGELKAEPDPARFMLICGSCNRAKSWSCEHCRNWTHDRDANICMTCYWASPTQYIHIALRAIRRLDVTWTAAEVPDYERLARLSRLAHEELPEFVKRILRKQAFRES